MTNRKMKLECRLVNLIGTRQMTFRWMTKHKYLEPVLKNALIESRYERW